MLSLKWAIPEKIKEMEGGIGLRKPLRFLAYPWKSRTKQSFTPGNSTNSTPWKLHDQKPRPPEIPHDFFLSPPESSVLFYLTT